MQSLLPNRFINSLNKLRSRIFKYWGFPAFLLTLALFLLSSCRSSSRVSIPDAPPPYPSFAVPQERYQSAQVYGGQTPHLPYVPPYSESAGSAGATRPSPSFYTPPPSPPPRPPAYVSNQPVHGSALNAPVSTSSSNNHRFTLGAKTDLWALVQDGKGRELEWIKLKAGESTTLSQTGELTITCSSGDQLEIKDRLGKQIETNPNPNGISIVRLPANI